MQKTGVGAESGPDEIRKTPVFGIGVPPSFLLVRGSRD
jgi:hypothetical protein